MEDNNLFQENGVGLFEKEHINIKDNIFIMSYMNSNWEFLWNPYPKPKIIDDENVKLLPKNWQYSLDRLIQMKSIIGILKENQLDSTNIINKEKNEIAKISLDYLENEYKNRLENLNLLKNSDDKNAMFAGIIVFINECFDYKQNLKYKNRDTFLNAMLGTASQISLEKTLENNKNNLSNILCDENTENLNYFGRKILEQRQAPKNKDEFIFDLKNHCKSGITNDEIVILYKMYNLSRPPSLLNAEHKKLIKESLNIARENNKINGLDDSVKKDINNLIDSKEKKAIKFANNKKEQKNGRFI